MQESNHCVTCGKDGCVQSTFPISSGDPSPCGPPANLREGVYNAATTFQPTLASAPNSKAFWGDQALMVLTQCYHWPSSRASWEPKAQHTGGMSHRNTESLPPSVRLQNQPRPGQSTCTRGEIGRPYTWAVGWGRHYRDMHTPSHACTHAHMCTHNAHVPPGRWGGALQRHAHMHTYAHVPHAHT